MQVEGLDTTAVAYINELKADHERHIQSLQSLHEHKYEALKNDYEQLKEKYDLLIYKRFGRSAERLFEDTKQQLLFAEEADHPEPETKEEESGLQEVKSFTRKKAGRKPLGANLPRREKIIDISEDEKTCACGAILNRIGEETSERLQIIPPEIYV